MEWADDAGWVVWHRRQVVGGESTFSSHSLNIDDLLRLCGNSGNYSTLIFFFFQRSLTVYTTPPYRVSLSLSPSSVISNLSVPITHRFYYRLILSLFICAALHLDGTVGSFFGGWWQQTAVLLERKNLFSCFLILYPQKNIRKSVVE
jgi:hypothetical protein